MKEDFATARNRALIILLPQIRYDRSMQSDRLSMSNLGNFKYETRIVSFFDILGWKNKILAAQEDPERLAELAFMAHMLSVFEGDVMPAQDGAILSSFSDNVVASIRYSPEYLEPTLRGLAAFQLGLATMGHYVRGAVTVGRLYHTRKAVFGPALIRASEMEKNEAKFPRIILDQNCTELAGLSSLFLREEDGVIFVNSFRPELASQLQQHDHDTDAAAQALGEAQGISISLPHGLVMPGKILNMLIANRLRQEIDQTLSAKDREKLTWLYNQVVNS